MDEQGPRGSLEARLAGLRARMESGLADRARSLRDAAARLGAGDAGAREEIRRQAHQLRGSAGSYGFDALGELGARLERAAIDAEVSSAAIVDLARALGDELERAAPAAIAETAPAKAGVSALAGKRVLAIDDDDATRRLLDLTLRALGGSEARIVSSPEEALAAIAERAFDLAIVDAMMPTMSGLELAARLRAHGLAAPIAFLSAAAQVELGWELPARSAWIRKPFRPRELLDRLGEIVARDA